MPTLIQPSEIIESIVSEDFSNISKIENRPSEEYQFFILRNLVDYIIIKEDRIFDAKNEDEKEKSEKYKKNALFVISFLCQKKGFNINGFQEDKTVFDYYIENRKIYFKEVFEIFSTLGAITYAQKIYLESVDKDEEDIELSKKHALEILVKNLQLGKLVNIILENNRIQAMLSYSYFEVDIKDGKLDLSRQDKRCDDRKLSYLGRIFENSKLIIFENIIKSLVAFEAEYLKDLEQEFSVQAVFGAEEKYFDFFLKEFIGAVILPSKTLDHEGKKDIVQFLLEKKFLNQESAKEFKSLVEKGFVERQDAEEKPVEHFNVGRFKVRTASLSSSDRTKVANVSPETNPEPLARRGLEASSLQKKPESEQQSWV